MRFFGNALDGPEPKRKNASSQAMEKHTCVVNEAARQEILEKVILFYQESLKAEPKAQAYLEKKVVCFIPRPLSSFAWAIPTVIFQRPCLAGKAKKALKSGPS
jgi:hypothetical protein